MDLATASLLVGLLSAVVAMLGTYASLRARRDQHDTSEAAPPLVEQLPAVPAPPPGTPTPPPGWGDRPAPLGERLFGRADDLDVIDAAFEQHRWVVLAGGAGTGKSQLAAEWTHRAAVDGYWTTARTDASATIAALAPLLGIDEARPEDEVVADVCQALGELDGSEAVWVVDTPESVALCIEVRGLASPGPRMLFTTRDVRRGQAPANVGWREVEPLKAEDSVRLLQSRGYDGPADALEAVAEAVGHLPLALETLAGLLADGTSSPNGLIDAFAAAPTVQLDAFLDDPRTKGPPPNIERSQGVFATLTALLDALPEGVRERIAGLGYLADAPVPLDLLAAVCDVERDSAQWRELVNECQRRSVFKITGETARIHALTAAALAATQPDESVRTALERTGDRLAELRISPPAFLDEEAHYRGLLAAAERALPVADKQLLGWKGQLATTYWSAGRYAAATSIGEQVLATYEDELGEEHAETLTSRNNLAASYRAAGRHDEAITLHERNLAMRERALGDEHSNTLISRNNLAESYRVAGRNDEASTLHERNLEARKRVLGEEHPDTLSSQNNLAASYFDAGRIDDAVALHERNLAARVRVLGEEHPNTLASRNNLAASYHAAGSFNEAVRLLERSLEALERVLGKEHPATLISRHNLALSYREAGRFDEALALFEPNLEAYERVLGPEHPDTLISRDTLIAAYDAAGRDEDAARLREGGDGGGTGEA